MRRAVIIFLLCAVTLAGCQNTPSRKGKTVPEPQRNEVDKPQVPTGNPHEKEPPAHSDLPEMASNEEEHGPLSLGILTSDKTGSRNVSIGRPRRVRGRLDVPLKRDWTSIVVHHSGTTSGSEESFHRYHKQVRGWRGIGYDFVIGNGHGTPDGVIEVTFRWEKQIQGAHAGVDRYNQHGIGICLVGNFNSEHPTKAQMDALVQLVSYLQKKCHIPTSRILGHRHVKNTKCPGDRFPYFQLLSRLPH